VRIVQYLLIGDHTYVPHEASEKLLCVMLTFQCTAECEHCGTASSPREHTRLPLDQALSAIDQAAALGYTGVVFTGGESTLAPENLRIAIRRAHSHNLSVRLVTNAHWATQARAETQLFEWIFDGLTQLNISTGDRHAGFVPLELPIRAARTAARLNLSVILLLESGTTETITASALRQLIPDPAVHIVEGRWSSLDPFPQVPPTEAVNRANLDRCTGCNELFQITTLQADGSITPCCGLGIRAIPELRAAHIGHDTLAEAEARALADPVLQRIRDEGPEKILAWSAERDPRIHWENLYAHRCHACIRLFHDPLVRDILKLGAAPPPNSELVLLEPGAGR